MTGIKLSICIPTYNFGKFLTPCLDSVLKQISNEVEIIIVDGGSTDNTSEVIQGFQKSFSRIDYIRLEKKGGIDKDLALTVEKAHGEYCWLLSSDDLIKPGAIGRILDETQSGYGVYLGNRTVCDINLNPIREQQWLSGRIEDQVFNFSDNSELIDYLNKSQSLGALFSYMSTIIVNRKKWMNVDYNEIFTGSHYAHVFRIFTLLRSGGLLKYIKDPLIKCRTGNDSFLDHGIGNRFLIDLKGYQLLADELFGKTPVVRNYFMSVMRREHVWYGLICLRSEISNIVLWEDLKRRFMIFGYSEKQLLLVGILGLFKPIISLINKFTNLKRKLGRVANQNGGGR
ncbi:MAG: glycosyltransferase family 2 protein [Nitrospirae bacterium]|nr:glycosyltransferase family 2 protein [Nitrospirota bacterium]MBI3593458.1 glycosyltransferase family 2 protein [Nitrospirota bacterium]